MPGFSVLVVCTANLCRSPAAAALLEAALPAGSGVRVSSAGTRAVLGEAVPVHLVRALARRGVDVGDHRPRQLSAEMISAADLVLVATRAHRATVVGAVPGAVARTFTLREMARLLTTTPAPRWGAGDPGGGREPSGDDEAARWGSLAPTAAQRRSARVGEEDDLADPYRRSSRVYRASVEQIGAAAATIVAAAGSAQPSWAVSRARSSVDDVPGV